MNMKKIEIKNWGLIGLIGMTALMPACQTMRPSHSALDKTATANRKVAAEGKEVGNGGNTMTCFSSVAVANQVRAIIVKNRSTDEKIDPLTGLDLSKSIVSVTRCL